MHMMYSSVKDIYFLQSSFADEVSSLVICKRERAGVLFLFGYYYCIRCNLTPVMRQ